RGQHQLRRGAGGRRHAHGGIGDRALGRDDFGGGGALVESHLAVFVIDGFGHPGGEDDRRRGPEGDVVSIRVRDGRQVATGTRHRTREDEVVGAGVGGGSVAVGVLRGDREIVPRAHGGRCRFGGQDVSRRRAGRRRNRQRRGGRDRAF